MTAKELGKRLKKARQEKHITQDEMARVCGVSKNHISVIERGLNNCSAHILISYAENLHTSLDELIGIENTAENIIPELMHTIKALSPQQQQKVLDVIRIIFS